ncbi:hypothetical protein SAMN06265174_102629 [Dietzia kunjamensis subsp. schimae]|uniref:YbjN domain-containing protein n=1 Tax=Dietzia kunjamensis subsp. schimae TaxID=498198 RepID=A0ABY1N042_9ACTN|nr:YbjN domain-containing protein [Dietzia kunjamensis]MBB1013954.1 YbjN domain-containing protein [Dietzia kunjamensis subsp. schimae]SMO61471.1 hypothetical protein SAMN06265174_102629 [Dietzia kunjamensis subsp. schimae]
MREGPGINDLIGGAWDEYEHLLATRIKQLERGSHFSFALTESDDDTTPYFQISTSSDGEHVLAEVSSNQVLTGRYRLEPHQIGDLLHLGWLPPTPPMDKEQIPNFFVVEESSNPAVATLIVATLRSVFGVPHPDFLDPAPREDDLHSRGSEPFDPHEGEDPLPVDDAFHPRDFDELRWALSQAMRNHFGAYRAPSEDGSFSIRVGTTMIKVRPYEQGIIEVLGFVVSGMRRPALAVERLVELNAQTFFARFEIVGDSIIASCDFPALPFVPRHLYTVLNMLSSTVDAVDDELAEMTGGATMFGEWAENHRDMEPSDYDPDADEDAEDAEPLPEELLALIHMDNEDSTELDPDLVARLMHCDQALILRCIRLCEEQMISWNESARSADDKGDDDETGACRHEADAWGATVPILTRALHSIASGTE